MLMWISLLDILTNLLIPVPEYNVKDFHAVYEYCIFIFNILSVKYFLPIKIVLFSKT
jgi:hypothetical protein